MKTTTLGLKIGRPLAIQCVIVLGAVAAGPAYADSTLAVGVDASAGYTDNVRRTSTDEQQEGLAQAGVRFAGTLESARAEGDLVGDLGYLHYPNNVFQSRVIGQVAGYVKARFVPDRFEWFASDNFGQARTDPFAAETPDNIENINFFSTGPEFLARFGDQTRLRVSGRASRVDFQKTPDDYDQYEGTASLAHSVSRISVMSLNLHTSRVQFEDTVRNSDYKIHDAYVTFEATGTRTQLAVDLGMSRLDSQGDQHDSALWRLDLLRKVTARSTVSVHASREFSSAGDVLRQLQSSGGVSQRAQSVQISGDPFTHKYYSIDWNFDAQRTTAYLSLARETETYQRELDLNRTFKRASGSVRRQISPLFSATLTSDYTDSTNPDAGRDYREIHTQLLVSLQATRRLSYFVRYERQTRDGNIATDSYTQNQYWIGLTYGNNDLRSSIRDSMRSINRR